MIFQALLQEIGYSRATIQPNKPALKSPGEPSDKSKKVRYCFELPVTANKFCAVEDFAQKTLSINDIFCQS